MHPVYYDYAVQMNEMTDMPQLQQILGQLHLLPILLFSVVIHEVAHGWMALRLGDPTAKDLGRLTLNPIPHIDPVGSVIVPLFSLLASGRVFIAWAKPVPINPSYFSNYRRDDILVSIVGPLTNYALAFVCTLLVVLFRQLLTLAPQGPSFEQDALRFIVHMFAGGISLNIVLAVFNMIPIPPLDGSHVLASFLPPSMSMQYRKIGFAGIILLLILMRWEPFARMFGTVIGTLMIPFTTIILYFQ